MPLVTIKVKRSDDDITSVIKNVETLEEANVMLQTAWELKGVKNEYAPITNVQLKEAHDSFYDYLPSDVEPDENDTHQIDEVTGIPKWL